MKKSFLLLSMFLLIGCGQASSDNNSSSLNSSLESSSSENSSTQVSTSNSSESSEDISSSEVLESVDLIIDSKDIKVGDEVSFRVNTLPSSFVDYSLISLNEDLLQVADNKVVALKAGVASLKVVVEDKEDIEEITIRNYSKSEIESIFTNNSNLEKDDLFKTNITYYNKSDEITYFDNEVSYYEGPSITSIKKYLNEETDEVISTTYSFLGTYQNHDYSMEKSIPSESSDKFSTSLDYYDNKELFYDSETGQTGIVNALNYLTFSSSYMDYDNVKSVVNSFENNQLTISLSNQKECESVFFWEDKYYLVSSMNIVIEENKIIDVTFSSVKYYDYDVSKEEFNDETSNKKNISYHLVWSKRGLEKDLNVVPTAYLPNSFDVKLYKEANFINESYVFDVGDTVYFNIVNVDPINAFTNMNIEANSKGGSVTLYNGITCYSAGEVELVFTSINGISKNVSIMINEVEPESVSFDSFMDSTIKVGGSSYIFYTVLPENADDSVVFEIVDGEEYISIEDGKIVGLKEGTAHIKVSCVKNLNIYDIKEIKVEA